MATKLTLTDVTSGFNGITIQANFTAIEDEFDKCLYRDGTGPNQMNATLDMNGFAIEHIGAPLDNTGVARLQDILDAADEDLTVRTATLTSVTDSGAYYANNNVEGVLQELGFLMGLTGLTASAAEMNILDGVTASTAELNKLDGVTASTAELNILDGVTSTTAELNILDGVTATASELNKADADTAGGGFMIASAASDTVFLTFGTWRTPNANRPVLVQLRCRAETDGVTSGNVYLGTNEAGLDTTVESWDIAYAPDELGTGGHVLGSLTSYIPAGGAYVVVNAADPNSGNAIAEHVEYVL